MTEWPYEEPTPLYSLESELEVLSFHLEQCRYFKHNMVLYKENYNLHWQLFLHAERRFNDGLVWC